MDEYVLANGVKFPKIGLGTWRISDREVMAQVLKTAVDLGYRMVDTAAAYSNEIAVGKAIKSCGIPREELFVTDKVWNTNHGYAQAQEACKKSLRKLKLDYLDAYLIHWPSDASKHENADEINADTWRGLDALYREGLVRSIGVCNFGVPELENLIGMTGVTPMINQTELHPGCPQEELLSYCRGYGIQVIAAAPLGSGGALESEVIKRIAKDKGRTAAQIALRWCIQKGAAAVPKSTNAARLAENIDVFGFSLTEEEMGDIDAMPYSGGVYALLTDEPKGFSILSDHKNET